MRELRDVRADIDRTDRDLVELLARRAALVREAFAIKADAGSALRDAAREEEILRAVMAHGGARGLPEPALREVFTAIVRFARVVSGDAP